MKRWKLYAGSIFLLMSVFFLSGCGADPVVKVGDERIELSELMYYVYQAEEDGKVYEEMYRNFFSEDYWDAEYTEGVTFREAAKKDAYENGIMYTIFEQEAEAAGYSLTEEEEADCEKEATEEYAGLSESQREAIGLKREEFIQLQKKIMLGNKFYDALMAGVEFDEDKAVSRIFEEDYIQHDVEYLYAQSKETLEPYLERALAGENFDSMAEENQEELEAGSLGFMDGDYSLGQVFEEEALKLSDKEVCSHIVAEEDGYYIIRMIEKNSTEGYEAACEEAVLNARNEAFQAAYEEIKKTYEIKEYSSDWDSLVIGNLTTGEAENKKQEEE